MRTKLLDNNYVRLALGTVVIVLVSFIAMQLWGTTTWRLIDFLVLGLFFFSIGASYMVTSKGMKNPRHLLVIGLTLLVLLLAAWGTLAFDQTDPELQRRIYFD